MATEYRETEIHAQGDITGGIEIIPVNILRNFLYKVIIFLHGIGERGNGGDLQLDKLRTNGSVSGIEAAVKNAGNFLLFEPQTPSLWQYDEVDEMYDIIMKKYGDIVDPNCFYLTGLSLGGGGNQRYMSRNPKQKKFAAYAPMCPGGNSGFITNGEQGYINIAQQERPGWFFHCADDTIVTPEQSTNLTYRKAKAINPDAKIVKTIWKSGAHTGGWKTYSRYGTGVPACSPAEALDFNNPACNLLQWFEMNRLDKPAVMPPIAGYVPPVDIPDQPTDLVVHGFNIYGENVKIQLVRAGGKTENIEAPAGSVCKNIWIPNLMPLRASMELWDLTSKTKGSRYIPAEADFIGFNVYGTNVKAQIRYKNDALLVHEKAPAGDVCNNIWIPEIAPLRGTMSFAGGGFKVIGKV